MISNHPFRTGSPLAWVEPCQKYSYMVLSVHFTCEGWIGNVFPHSRWKWYMKYVNEKINRPPKHPNLVCCTPHGLVMLCIYFLIEALYPFTFTAGLCAYVCAFACVRLCLATDQKYSWEHVERKDWTEHAQMLSTGRWAQCYRYLYLFLLCVPSLLFSHCHFLHYADLTFCW